jgi:PAS domain S-box-containing protein
MIPTAACQSPLAGQTQRLSHEMFRLLADGLGAAAWLIAPDPSETLYVNPAYESVWGQSRQRLYEAYDSWLDAICREDLDRVRRASAAAALAEPFETEYRLLRFDGSVRWIRHRGFALGGAVPAGRVYAHLAQDITEAKQAQEECERLFNSSPDLMAILGFDGFIKRMNTPSGLATYISRDVLCSQPFLNFVHLDDRQLATNEIAKSIADGTTSSFEMRCQMADGSYHWFWWTGTAYPDRKLIYATARDINERRQAEEAFVARARQQEAVAELGRRALGGRDVQQLMADAAKAAAEVLHLDHAGVLELQLDRSELVLRAVSGAELDAAKPTRVSAAPSTLSGYVLSIKKPVVVTDLRTETRFRGAPILREHKIVSAVACIIQGADRPYGVLAAFSTELRAFSENDVSFLQSVANTLGEAIAKQRALEELDRFFTPSLNPMFIGGFDGYVKRVNPAAEKLSGYSRDELLAVPLINFAHPDDQAAVAEELFKLASGESAVSVEFRVHCKDGSYKWALFNITTFPDLQAFYAIAYDLTERRKAEETLAEHARQQQAVAELGGRALVGGDLDPLFNEAVVLLSRTLHVELTTFLELQPDGRAFSFKAGYGWEPGLIGEARMPVDSQLLCGYVLESEQPVVVEDIAAERRFRAHPLAVAHKVVSEMACLVPGRRPHGVLCVHSLRRRRFTEDDVHFTQSVGNILAAAIERRAAEEELNRFFDPSLNPMYVGGFDGMIKRCNRALQALTGYTNEELMARPLWTIIHHADRRALFTEAKRLMAGRSTLALELRVKCKDGSYAWTLWNAASFPESRLFYATGQDVTDRRLAEEALRASEETLRVTSESVPDGIIRIDAEGKVAQWNAAAEKMFGYAGEEILGRDLSHTLVPDEARERFERIWLHFRETGHGPFIGKAVELEALRKDGVRFPVEASIGAVSLDGKWNAVADVRDITQRKRDEAELITAKLAAEAASRAKSEFLANMSHEIRTPMNGVIGLTSLVLDTPLNKEQRQYLDGVMLSAEALLKIINDILDFSKIEAGRLELESADFDLRETMANTMQTLAVRAHQKGLELLYDVRAETPDALVGDPARLWQVLVNLVGNAIKFTHQGEVAVSVGVETLENDAACLKFTVSDTGIGIPANKQRTLFKPFSQGDSSMSRKYGGTGLGLAISAQIVEMMNGRIWFESELGKGSQFHFTAWFGRRTAHQPKRAPLPPSALDGLRVLIVDDSATNRMILREMLTHWGMRPDEADCGTIALDALQAAYQAADPLALILLDVMMPDLDGFAVLERIRQMPEIDRPVIMMLSSNARQGDAARAKALGAAAYIVKPVRPSELLEAIVHALNISFESTVQSPGSSIAAVGSHGPSLRILVAEDNPINQMLAVRVLEKAGHRMAVANNGEEVLAAVAREPFDLVLMDVQMPVMDGFEATALIRQQEKGSRRRLPIVAMTAHAMKGDREKCLEAGMDGYVTKPIQKDELFGAIAAAVHSEIPAALH